MKMRRKGFTLIELLVVIGIIMILAAILTPVLMSAKERANRVTCVNNIRQIGMQMQIWANDHDGVFPYFADTTLTAVATTCEQVYNLIVGPQFSDNKVFLCPNNGSFKPPTITRTNASGMWLDASGGAAGSDVIVPLASATAATQTVSYVPVWAVITSANPDDIPNANDAGDNVLIMEDPSPGGEAPAVYSALDNHKDDGGMVYYISGRASFFSTGTVDAGPPPSRTTPMNIDRSGQTYLCCEHMLLPVE